MTKTRVCVIGAGLSGLSLLYQAKKLGRDAELDIVCYERQAQVGGLWNYDWRTGLDALGQPVHASMYRFLYINGPKEASLEYADYTYERHFGRATPSYPPRAVVRDYLGGRFQTVADAPGLRLQHSVESVRFDDDTNTFAVVARDLQAERNLPAETFDFVLNATGHYSVPNVPEFPGFASFPGRVLHAHDFRDAREFAGKRLLVVGASYSAEDLAMQAVKFGAAAVTISHRGQPLELRFPGNVAVRPLLTGVVGNRVDFPDAASVEVDAIILATGYRHHYPYLPDQLRLTGRDLLFPDRLYRATVWTGGAGGRLLYLGAMLQYYSFMMFDVQAVWAIKYICGEVKMPSDPDAVEADTRKWQAKEAGGSGCPHNIEVQSDYVVEMAKECGYGADVDCRQEFQAWYRHKVEDLGTFRDQTFASKYTGSLSTELHVPYMQIMEEDLETFLANN